MRMPLASLVYGLALEVVVWTVMLPWAAVRALLGRSGWDEVGARMGWAPPRFGDGRRRVLVHAVSAGEVAAAEPLLRLLLEALPPAEVLLTTGNRTGLDAVAALAARLPGVRGGGLLPWDRPLAWRRWIGALDPQLVVVMETELWPNFFLACRHARIPLALINGRIYPHDLPRYRLVRGLMKRVLGCADLIGAQDVTEAERFLALGAPRQRLVVGGNTKFDARAAAPARGEPLPCRGSDGGLLLVGGSTHAPEERWLLDACASLSKVLPRLRLVLVPRHPQRAARILRSAVALGFRAFRESTSADRGDWDVLVVDRMGGLPTWYGRADLAFVGGTLVRRGGHNILEAAVAGCPILVGPYTAHYAGIVAHFRAYDALVQLEGPAQLPVALRGLLEDGERRRSLAQRALGAAAGGRGAAQIYCTHLVRLLAAEASGV